MKKISVAKPFATRRKNDRGFFFGLDETSSLSPRGYLKLPQVNASFECRKSSHGRCFEAIEPRFGYDLD